MLKRFINALPHLTLNLYTQDGEMKVDIKLPGGVARGIRRKGSECIFEIRTYLKETQLSSGQKRHTDSLNDSVAEGIYVPDEVRLDRIQRSENQEEAFYREMEDMKKLFCRQGGNPELFEGMMKVGVWIPNIWMRMGFEELLSEEFLQRHTLVNQDAINNYIRKGCDKEQFTDLMEVCSRNMKMKPFDRQKAEAVIADYFREISE